MIKFKRVKLTNFMSFKDEVFNLDERGLLLILGQNNTDAEHFRSNASGKSAMFDAIYYALYGNPLRKINSVDDVIRRGTEEASVELEFEVGGDEYKIVRARKKNGGTLQVFNGDKDISTNDMRETQKEIINKMINPDISRSAIFFLASEFQSFITLGDADKKGIITKIFALDKVERYRAIAKDRHLTSLTAYDKLESEQKFYISNIADLKKSIDEFNVKDAEKVANAIKIIEEGLKLAMEREAEKKKEVIHLKEVIKELREGYDIDIEKKRKLSMELSEEKIHKNNMMDELEKIEKLIAKGKCPTCRGKVQKSNFASEIESLKTGIDDINVDGIQKKLADVEKDIAKAKEYIDGYEEKLSDDENKLERIRREINDKTKELSELKVMKGEFDTKLNNYKSDLKKNEKGLEDCEKKLEEAKEKVSLYEFWVNGFGPQGIVSYILDAYFPKFNMLLNEYLQTLFGTGVYAKFSPFTQLKSGEFREKWSFDIEGLGSYASCSAGEKRRIDVAVLFALNTMVRDMIGGTNILVIDEVFDPLDDVGAERVIELLKKLNLSSVFVVTHNEALQEQFSNQITVVKSKGVSKIIS